jgi:hypothetical protein
MGDRIGGEPTGKNVWVADYGELTRKGAFRGKCIERNM